MVWGQIFGTICGIDVGIGIPIFAALRAAVFELSAKNLRGGRIPAPPVGARVKAKAKCIALKLYYKNDIYKIK